jgi:tRNA-modifying protein YgfZ
MIKITQLPDRGVIELAGEDRIPFLQGLVSNDISEAAPGRAVWAALLTPQGKYLSDFFVLSDGTRLLLDCPRADAAMLATRLARFRLRARATLRDASGELAVHAAWGGTPDLPPATLAAPDPRLPEAGWRILADTALATNATPADWNAHRLALGLPDSADLEAEKTVLLEAGFDELNGVSWTKGCYMGQELTARTKYRGLVKRRLVPVALDGPLPTPGSRITHGDQDVGTMRSGQNQTGLALLRLEALNQPLTCGTTHLTPRLPTWLRMPVMG